MGLTFSLVEHLELFHANHYKKKLCSFFVCDLLGSYVSNLIHIYQYYRLQILKQEDHEGESHRLCNKFIVPTKPDLSNSSCMLVIVWTEHAVRNEIYQNHIISYLGIFPDVDQIHNKWLNQRFLKKKVVHILAYNFLYRYLFLWIGIVFGKFKLSGNIPSNKPSFMQSVNIW